MSASESRVARGLGRSAGLVSIGLAAEAISMAWNHPTAFLLFAFVGGALVAVGILDYLWTIARAS